MTVPSSSFHNSRISGEVDLAMVAFSDASCVVKER